MLKAQEIHWSKFQIDTEDPMTLSALAMRIFRQNDDYYKNFPIHIPNRNVDTFIRRGHYGGHTDVYKPFGEDLYYYDVNSLYPFVMKEFPMPGGVPVWRKNLEEVELDTLFGFFEAYVECPSHISRPFLPYKDQNSLLFPTGKFIGIYYSEELKYAGYEIRPLRGYMFEKMSSPFEEFISNLYESRQEARRAVTEVCREEKYLELMMMDNFQSAEKLTDSHYLVNYTTNSGCVSDEEWKAPRIMAVQLSAAITAMARMKM
ncbi:hypothetical protein ZIOFF_056126 [Zingiber officinale]|uniref:DNA-directed DNA polymerase n=1 Tax=Zingiber officinale TaxID=94328 RepID=A0A8J5FLM5_ZINOF|nr:hypothetical protein ZIOFF_056126 [Zingiber officinale]